MGENEREYKRCQGSQKVGGDREVGYGGAGAQFIRQGALDYSHVHHRSSEVEKAVVGNENQAVLAICFRSDLVCRDFGFKAAHEYFVARLNVGRKRSHA